MSKTLVVGALMFVFGSIAGVSISSLLSSGDDPAVEAISRDATTAESIPDLERDAPRFEADAPEDGATPRAAQAEVADIESMRRDAVASSQAPPRVRGDGIIEGRVTNPAGEGVRGVTIKASIAPARGTEASKSKLGRAASDRSLDAEIQNTVDSWQKKRSSTIEATSDSNGDFRLVELGAGPWSLSANAEGYVVTPRSMAGNVLPGSKLNFEAIAVVRVPIAVLLPDGRAAKRANLEVRGTGSSGHSLDLWTADESELVVAPGVYTVRAILVESQLVTNDYALEAASEKTRVEAMTQGAVQRVELKLEPRHGIRGRVMLADGIKMQQGAVTLQQIPAGGKPDLEAMANNDDKSWINNSNNFYEFLDLAPGSYAVGLMSGWSGPILTHAVVKVEQGIVQQDLLLDAVDGAGFIDVEVVGPKGEPLACSNFLYLVESEHGSTSSWLQGLEQGPGHYWIAPDDNIKDWQKNAAGEKKLKLTAKSDVYGDKTLEVPLGTLKLRFEFGEAATLDVVVVGYVGSGLEGTMDVQLRRAGEPQHYYSNESNLKADGTAKFGPIEVGTYQLVLEAFGENRWNRRQVATQEIVLAVGPNRCSIAMPAMYTLVVTLGGAEANQDSWISIQGNDRWDNSRTTNGRVEFKNLPPGEYTVHGDIGGKQARASVKIPDQLAVTLVAKAPNAMSINIVDESKYLKSAGFEGGDLIVGFDGVEFADESVMQATFSTLISKKVATAIVYRGSQRLEISVEPARLLDPTQVGGNWWPSVR